MFDNLKILSEIDAVSGCEDTVREKIIELTAPFADEIFTDTLGNLTVFKKGAKRAACKLIICAHMDQPGLMITGATSDGYLQVIKVGKLDNAVLLGKHFWVGKNNIPAVSGCPPIHLIDSESRRKPLKTGSLLLDIGAKNKEEALSLVMPGERAAFDSIAEDFGENLIKGKSLDSRSGCAIAMEFIKSELLYDTTFIFTVQKECGSGGAACAAFAAEPDFAIILEGMAAHDIPPVPTAKQICALGKGAVVSIMDKGAIYDRKAFELVEALSKENNIPLQINSSVGGSGDSAAINTSGKGVRVFSLGVPCRHHNSACEVISKGDVAAVKDICTLLAEKVCAGDLL